MKILEITLVESGGLIRPFLDPDAGCRKPDIRFRMQYDGDFAVAGGPNAASRSGAFGEYYVDKINCME